jgi:hypothetical protein
MISGGGEALESNLGRSGIIRMNLPIGGKYGIQGGIVN